MTPRRIIFSLIVLTVAVFCLVAARKLMATSRYDRIQVGEAVDLHGGPTSGIAMGGAWHCTQIEPRLSLALATDEGFIEIDCITNGTLFVADKRIKRRGPLERLAWLAGWRRQGDQAVFRSNFNES